LKIIIKLIVLFSAIGLIAAGYEIWHRQDRFSCSSVDTVSLVHQIIANGKRRAFPVPDEKSRIDQIPFNLTDIVTVSDGKQTKRCQGMVSIPVPANIPVTETFSGLQEVLHVQVEGRTILVPITYEAQLTDNQKKEFVSIDNVIPIMTTLSELAKTVEASDEASNKRTDRPQVLANQPRKEPAADQNPAISNSWVQLTPEQAATECSIERDILQMAARFRFDNENHVSDQQVEKFINSHLGELVNSYQIGEWNQLITIPGGPTSIEANVKVAAFFGKSAPLSRLQELAAGTGPNEPAEHDKCLARYATPVPSSMPKVSWE